MRQRQKKSQVLRVTLRGLMKIRRRRCILRQSIVRHAQQNRKALVRRVALKSGVSSLIACL